MHTPAPKKLTRGPQWLQKIVNDLIDYAVQTHITSIEGARLNQTASGTLVSGGKGGLGLPDVPSEDGKYVLAIDRTAGDLGQLYWLDTTDTCPEE
jgi:hypothetical protein